MRFGFRSALVLALLPALAAPASACLWYYGKNVQGKQVTFDGHFGDLELARHLTEHPEHGLQQTIDTAVEPGPEVDYKIRSDFAATLVHQSKAARAIPILEAIEKEQPREYIIAGGAILGACVLYCVLNWRRPRKAP
ncbi:MAG TPA: hypothetical protein VE981_21140 [Planctomycetota bacterium]|nr:hypothetical protein [Planctomycetota bacterium]